MKQPQVQAGICSSFFKKNAQNFLVIVKIKGGTEYSQRTTGPALCLQMTGQSKLQSLQSESWVKEKAHSLGDRKPPGQQRARSRKSDRFPFTLIIYKVLSYTFYYGLNAFPPHIHSWKPNPQSDGIRRWVLWEV